jgi:hypothetical protein
MKYKSLLNYKKTAPLLIYSEEYLEMSMFDMYNWLILQYKFEHIYGKNIKFKTLRGEVTIYTWKGIMPLIQKGIKSNLSSIIYLLSTCIS